MTAFGTAYVITTSANGTIAEVPANVYYYQQSFRIINNGTAVVTLGHATAGAQGYPLYAGDSLSLSLAQGEVLYGFVAAGTADVRVLGVSGPR